MKMFAMLGDLVLFIYLAGVAVMTIINASRAMFDPYIKGQDEMGFMARQGMIFIWPFAMFSDSGQKAFGLIWKGRYDDQRKG
jgi:hypothetical protein